MSATTLEGSIDNGEMRRAVRGFLVFVPISLVSCADYRDAVVVNPCAHHIEVFLEHAPPEEVENFYPPSYRVAPLSARRIENVLQGPGEDSYTAKVVIEGDESVIEVERVEEDPVPVVVPARLCRTS